MNSMNKPLRILAVIPFLFFSCNFKVFDNNTQGDNFIQNVLNDPNAQYVLKGVVDTLGSIPPITLNNNDRWIFHHNSDPYNQLLDGDESNSTALLPDTLTVSNLSDSTITFNSTVNYNINKMHQQINNVTFLNNLYGEPLPPNGYHYSKVIKMDDSSFTYSVGIDTNTYKCISDQKIINSKYGVLYEQWDISSEVGVGTKEYLALLNKNGVNVPLGKTLNEFYAKDSVLK